MKTFTDVPIVTARAIFMNEQRALVVDADDECVQFDTIRIVSDGPIPKRVGCNRVVTHVDVMIGGSKLLSLRPLNKEEKGALK